jgi:hypothetical protein
MINNPFIEVEMLDLFFQVVTEEDNFSLCSIPTKLDVIQALAALDLPKPLVLTISLLSSIKNIGVF